MSLHRAGPICGLLFLPLYAAFTQIPELPQASDSDERVLELYTDPGKSGLILIGSLLMAVAGVVLLVFLADLWRRLRAAGELATLAVGAGFLYVAMLFVAGALWGGYAGGGHTGVGASPLEDAPDLEQSATLARVLTEMGFGVLLVYGLLAAGVMIVATARAGRRTGALPRGVVVASYLIAPLLLAGFTWIPQYLVPLWVLAVSVSFLRRSPATQVDAARREPAAVT